MICKKCIQKKKLAIDDKETAQLLEDLAFDLNELLLSKKLSYSALHIYTSEFYICVEINYIQLKFTCVHRLQQFIERLRKNDGIIL